jgi:hypothetical protein
LRDAIKHFNPEGVGGHHHRPRSGRPAPPGTEQKSEVVAGPGRRQATSRYAASRFDRSQLPAIACFGCPRPPTTA